MTYEFLATAIVLIIGVWAVARLLAPEDIDRGNAGWQETIDEIIDPKPEGEEPKDTHQPYCISCKGVIKWHQRLRS